MIKGYLFCYLNDMPMPFPNSQWSFNNNVTDGRITLHEYEGNNILQQ